MRARSKRRLLAVVLGLAIGCGLTAGARHAAVGIGAPRTAPDPVPTSVLTADVPGAVEAGELEFVLRRSIWPGQWKARLRNLGTATVLLVRPGDGSSVGWRTPRLSWDVRTAGGDSVEQRPWAGCGNINPLRADELVLVEPGRALEFDVAPPYLPEEGHYSAALTYTNDPGVEWLSVENGRPPGGLAAVRRSTGCSVTSNWIELVRD